MISEKVFEDILCKYPELIEPSLQFKGRQVHIYGRRMDIIFEDTFQRMLIVELKVGPIKDEHVGQILSYEGILLSSENPTIRVMLIGNRVPPNIRNSLDHHGIAWKEITITSLKEYLKSKSDDEALSLFDSTDIAEQIHKRRERSVVAPNTSDKSKHQIAWEVQYNNLLRFRTENPDRWPSQLEQYPHGNNLGVWCSVQRVSFKRENLSQERIKLLSDIGFPFNKTVQEDVWLKQYQHLVNFRNENPNRWPRMFEEYPKGNNLGGWLSRQRYFYNKNKLTQGRLEKLERIGFNSREEVDPHNDFDQSNRWYKNIDLFLNSHVEVDITGQVKIAKEELFESYKKWCLGNDYGVISTIKFNQEVYRKYSKYTPKKAQDGATGKRIWRNLKIVAHKTDQAPIDIFKGSHAEYTQSQLEVFFGKHVEICMGQYVTKMELFEKYKKWCADTKNYTLGRAHFSAAVFKRFHKETPKSARIPSINKRVWRNIIYVESKTTD